MRLTKPRGSDIQGEGNELRKNRYPYVYEGRKYSVDVFLGDLRGLILAETDFDDDEEMDNFPAPLFTLMDVTRDEMFTGGRLAYLTSAEIRERLANQMDVKNSAVSPDPHLAD